MHKLCRWLGISIELPIPLKHAGIVNSYYFYTGTSTMIPLIDSSRDNNVMSYWMMSSFKSNLFLTLTLTSLVIKLFSHNNDA